MNRDIVPPGTVPIHAETADPGTGLRCFATDWVVSTRKAGTRSISPAAICLGTVDQRGRNPNAGFIVSERRQRNDVGGNSFFYA